MRTTLTALLSTLVLTLPAAAGDHAQAPTLNPVCNPSWGTITIPICL